MSKKLNIIEAMKMPVGTKFKVGIGFDYVEIFKGEGGEEGEKVLRWNGNKYAGILIGASTCEMELTPFQRSVSFIEAVKSGKRVRLEGEIVSKVYKKLSAQADERYQIKVLKELLEGKFRDLNSVIYALSGRMGSQDWEEVITEGKWYIDESEDLDDERLSEQH